MKLLSVGLLILCHAALPAEETRARPKQSGQGLIMIQTHHMSGSIAQSTSLQSGDEISLLVPHSGRRLAALPNGRFWAKKRSQSGWGTFTIVKKSGSGDIMSGDVVFLIAWTGNPLSVGGRSRVHSKWSRRGRKQELTIEKEGASGPIVDGDAIYLKAWTRAYVAADRPDAEGVVQARMRRKGFLQRLIVEEADGSATTPTPVPSTMPSTASSTRTSTTSVQTGTPSTLASSTSAQTSTISATPSPTSSAAPSTPSPESEAEEEEEEEGEEEAEGEEEEHEEEEEESEQEQEQEEEEEEAPSQGACVQKQSLSQCQPCLKSEQCGGGRYCCPYMKKCVSSSRDPCSTPVARCSPRCYDSMDNSQCTCANAAFPNRWQSPTCTEEQDTATTTPPEGVDGGIVGTTTSSSKEDAADTVSSEAWEHFRLVNQLRSRGFSCPKGETFAPNPVPLKFDCRLWVASRLHSEDMAAQNYFSHTSKDGRSPWQRAKEAGTDAHGENIAAGRSTAAASVEAFEKSDGHCRNMMKASFKVMAVGYAYQADSNYRHYWTQMYSLFDSVDTSCYPAGAALLQEGQLASAHVRDPTSETEEDDAAAVVLGKPISRPPA